ncbi:MAG: transposase, partial [Clostridia bacterium]
SYVFYFNMKYDRTGHLFQNRFFSKKIEDREYLKMVCRYIHQNPLKAGMEKTEKYKWSSYNEYTQSPKIINNKLLLSVFSKNIEEAKQEFIKFHNANINDDKETEIENMIEYELCERLTDDEIEKQICELLDINNVREISKYNTEIRNEKLSKLRCFKNISISQLSRITGINRKMIERAIKK